MTGENGVRDPAHCFHCGEPNPPRSSWRGAIDGQDAFFCCAGCLAVAQTIGAAGLSSFYALRQRECAPQRDGQSEPVAAGSYAATWIRPAADGMSDVALLLDGMRCGACVWLLETFLQRQPGVRSASVNFATRRAQLRFDGGETGLRELLAAVSRIGYRAYPYDPRRREALARQESRSLLLRMSLALLAMMQVMMFAVPAYISADGVDPEYQALMNWASLVLTLPVMLYSAAPFFVGAWRDLRVRRPGMDVPIALGIAAAFIASGYATVTGKGAVYFDSVTMFVALVLVARMLELRVREKAGDALESIAREMPQMADRLDRYPDARTCDTVPAADVEPGAFVRIAAGASVPVDGVIVDGRSSVEEAVLTGESWPRAKGIGDAVMAGSVNRESPLIVRVTSAGASTTLAALSRLVERAADERPRIARLSDRAASLFVMALLAIAAVSVVAWWAIDPSRALPVAFAVLVVSCPCALSLATPAALAAAAGAMGRRHVLCVRPDALETLSRVTHVVLDKTGTLTTGDVRLTGITCHRGADADACKSIAAALEQGSAHPIARALAHDAHGRAARDVVAVPGCGVEGVVDGVRYRLGRADWAATICASRCEPQCPADDADAATPETTVVLARDSGPIATLRFGDTLRPGAPPLVASLRTMGLAASLVSGDRASTVAQIARAVGIDDWHAATTPDAKRAFVAALQARGAVVAMVGDGINDAPGLARADVSIALGNAAALTQWTADVVVIGGDLARVAFAFRAARRTFRIIRENLAWALVYNVVAIPLAVSDHLSPLAAAVGMSVSSLVVVGNAWRLSRMNALETVAAQPSAPDARWSPTVRYHAPGAAIR
jgi:Cu2+-exporting ATPase